MSDTITMKAAVLFGGGRDWEIENIVLHPPRAREVLVRIKAAGLCHSDEHLRIGDLGNRLNPMIGGHEGSGVIEAIGPEVKSVAVGDHVSFSFIPSCGTCWKCASGQQNLCDLGAHLFDGKGQISDGTHRHFLARDPSIPVHIASLVGTFAEYSVVNELNVVKVDNDLPMGPVALVSCGVATGWGSAVNRAAVQPGEDVVVIGIGGLGAAAVQGARAAGARYVIAVDPVEFKRESAMQLGATHVAPSMDEAFPLVQEITWGRMAQKAIITVGTLKGEHIAQMMRLVAKGGAACVTAVSSDTKVDLSLMDLAMMQKDLRGVLFGGGNPRFEIPRLLGLYRTGQLKLDEMITRTYTLDQVNEGYRDMVEGKNIRGVITFD